MIRCGIDTIEIERLKCLNPAIRARFLIRVYTEAELSQACGRNDALSGLFTAKEAVAKALGTGIGLVKWQEIEILHLPSGEPEVHLHGNAALVAIQKGLSTWAVSISHDRSKAIAMAIASESDPYTQHNQELL